MMFNESVNWKVDVSLDWEATGMIKDWGGSKSTRCFYASQEGL